jgi:hypothetical protein
MNIYIACGLTHVPKEQFDRYVGFIHFLAAEIERRVGATVRYALKDSDPQLASRAEADKARLCYLWDRAMVEWAEAIVADATFPSIGLGIELQIAEQKGVPAIIAFRTADAFRAPTKAYDGADHVQHTLQIGAGYVSLMALGIPTVIKVVPYVAEQEAAEEICNAVLALERK